MTGWTPVVLEAAWAVTPEAGLWPVTPVKVHRRTPEVPDVPERSPR